MADEIISRKDAFAQGLRRYYTGKPCRRGHIAERALDSGSCLECGRIKQFLRYHADPDKYRALAAAERSRNRDDINVRKRAAYAADPEKHRSRVAADRAKLSPEQRKAIRKQSYAKRREEELERARKFRIENPDKARAQQRTYNRSDAGRLSRREWMTANKDRVLGRERDRRKKDPEKRRNSYRKWASKEESEAVIVANAHKRRTRLLASSGNHTPADLRAILKAQRYRCAYCPADLRKVKRHLDHITPLARGGSNGRENIQWTCVPCNLSKGARDPVAFARSLGLLL